MKVFEYSFKTGKGKEIANVKCSGNSCILGKHRGYPVHAGLEVITYQDDKSFRSEELYADNFTTADAILFCVGQDQYTEIWEWKIVPTEAMIDKAMDRNTRVYGTPHHNPDYKR